jgi:hypothetical protein
LAGGAETLETFAALVERAFSPPELQALTANESETTNKMAVRINVGRIIFRNSLAGEIYFGSQPLYASLSL